MLLSRLNARDFYLPFHQHFFTACTELQRLEKPIDEEFVRIELLKKKQFDEIAMIDLMAVNSIVNTEAYMADLINLSQKRSLVAISTQLKKEAIEEDKPALEIINSTIRRVEHIAENGPIAIKRKNIEDMTAHEQEFFCQHWVPIPKGTLSMVTAPGGTGKTWFVLQLAIRIAQESNRYKICLWLSEDPEGTIKSRYGVIQEKILSLYGTQSIDGQIDICTDDPLLLLETHGSSAKVSSKFYALKRELREYNVIVIDPLLAFYGGDENNNSHARIFMQPFLNWCRGEGKTIIFLHHSKKGNSESGSRSRGAGAIIDAVRCVYDMEHITVRHNDKQVHDVSKLGMRRFTLTKDNYGAARYTDGFVFDREITPKKDAQIVEAIFETDDSKSVSIDMPRIG